MSTSITLKNIPSWMYERLKADAVTNHRSLNGQVLATLQADSQRAAEPTARQLLASVRALRSTVKAGMTAQEISDAIADGRK